MYRFYRIKLIFSNQLKILIPKVFKYILFTNLFTIRHFIMLLSIGFADTTVIISIHVKLN